MTFNRGLRIFWKGECLPVVRVLAPAIGHGLEVGKYLLFSSWVVLPYCSLITGLENVKPLGQLPPHLFIYYGVAGIISQAIVVVVLFVRHVMRLGCEGDTR
ncbi:hypothetical protein HAP94_25510 [Acidithiobacillus ferrivorans]|nr:hypothetical protein [Acidithiobacillus ferrivorans]